MEIGMKKIGHIGLGLLLVLGAMLLREVVAGLELVGIAAYKVMSGQITKDDISFYIQSFAGNQEGILLVSAVATLVWIIVFGLIYYNHQKQKETRVFRQKMPSARLLLLAMMGFGLQFLINSILGSILKIAPDLLSGYQKVIETLGMGSSPLSLLYIVLIAPIGEELVFRGIVLDYLKKNTSFLAANVFQALFFGLYHMNVVQGIYAFILGMMLGYVANKYGSIRESILLHMAVNLSGCLVGFILPEALFDVWWGLLLLFLVSLGLLVFSIKNVTMETIASKE